MAWCCGNSCGGAEPHEVVEEGTDRYIFSQPPKAYVAPVEVRNSQVMSPGVYATSVGAYSSPAPAKFGPGETRILTRNGLMTHREFAAANNLSLIMPPLAPHPGVPMNSGGQPNIEELWRSNAPVSTFIKSQPDPYVSAATVIKAEAKKGASASKSGIGGWCSCKPGEQTPEIFNVPAPATTTYEYVPNNSYDLS